MSLNTPKTEQQPFSKQMVVECSMTSLYIFFGFCIFNLRTKSSHQYLYFLHSEMYGNFKLHENRQYYPTVL